MPHDESHTDKLPPESEVETTRINLLKLLRLLAKEVARRLARDVDNADETSNPAAR